MKGERLVRVQRKGVRRTLCLRCGKSRVEALMERVEEVRHVRLQAQQFLTPS